MTKEKFLKEINMSVGDILLVDLGAPTQYDMTVKEMNESKIVLSFSNGGTTEIHYSSLFKTLTGINLYTDKCPRCNWDAYKGMNEVRCTNSNCPLFDK